MNKIHAAVIDLESRADNLQRQGMTVGADQLRQAAKKLKSKQTNAAGESNERN